MLLPLILLSFEVKVYIPQGAICRAAVEGGPLPIASEKWQDYLSETEMDVLMLW